MKKRIARLMSMVLSVALIISAFSGIASAAAYPAIPSDGNDQYALLNKGGDIYLVTFTTNNVGSIIEKTGLQSVMVGGHTYYNSHIVNLKGESGREFYNVNKYTYDGAAFILSTDIPTTPSVNDGDLLQMTNEDLSLLMVLNTSFAYLQDDGLTEVPANPITAGNAESNPSGNNLNVTVGGGVLSMNAQTTDVTATASINKGVLSITSVNAEDLTVTDDRGSGTGWSVNMVATDFTATVPDPTSTNGGTLKVGIPIDSQHFFGVDVTNEVVKASGQDIDPMKGPRYSSPTTIYASTVARKIAETLPGAGMGEYRIPIMYNFKPVEQMNVLEVNNSNGTVNVGDKLGIVAAQFSSHLIYTVSTGI